LYNTLENSLLIKFLTDTFNNTTLLEISKRIELFKLCFNIVQNLCVDIMTNLLFNDVHNIYNALKKLYDISHLSAKFDKDNDIINNILFVWSLIEPLEKIYIEKKLNNIQNLQNEKNVQNQENTASDNKLDIYITELSKLRFDTANIINSKYKDSYMTQLKSTLTSTQCMKRLSTEIPTLANDLPIHQDASIFLRVDENNPRAMRALITGPPDTPYDSGIFIFDIYLPPDYPTGVPCVNFTNTGGKRFNPNLYQCGKVCLSILGTYVGPTASQTEKWNTSSTLYQVLISIQGQILVDHPYFNEPGYQNQYKTPSGTKNSTEYNKKIISYTMQHAMLDLLEDNNYEEFKDVITEHFKNKKNRIIEICENWTKINNDCKKICQKIKNKLNIL
jgi:ubiquitin-protein ligase